MGNQDNKMSGLDANQAIRRAFNDDNDSLTVDSYVVQRVGNKITMAIATTNVADDTEILQFLDPNAAVVYELTIIYTDATRGTMISVERTA